MASINQGFLGRPLRGRFSTVLLRRYLTMMLCTVDFGMCSSCPIDPSDLPSFQRSTTRWRCRTLCSLVFRQSGASVGAQRWQTVDTGGAASGLAAAARSEWVEQYQSSKYIYQWARGRHEAFRIKKLHVQEASWYPNNFNSQIFISTPWTQQILVCCPWLAYYVWVFVCMILNQKTTDIKMTDYVKLKTNMLHVCALWT